MGATRDVLACLGCDMVTTSQAVANMHEDRRDTNHTVVSKSIPAIADDMTDAELCSP